MRRIWKKKKINTLNYYFKKSCLIPSCLHWHSTNTALITSPKRMIQQITVSCDLKEKSHYFIFLRYWTKKSTISHSKILSSNLLMSINFKNIKGLNLGNITGTISQKEQQINSSSLLFLLPTFLKNTILKYYEKMTLKQASQQHNDE